MFQAVTAAVGLFASSLAMEAHPLADALGNCAASTRGPGLLKALDIPIDRMKVGYSSDGRDGVFFVDVDKPPHGKYVFKFIEGLDPGVVVARKMLDLARIPHDRLRVGSTDAGDVFLVSGRLGLAAKAGRYLSNVPEKRQQIDSKILANTRNPSFKTLMITDLVAAAHDMGNLQNLLFAQNARDAAGFVVGLHTLARPENQKMLGAIYVLDAFVGNADRLINSELNLGNLMVSGSDADTYCLVAIDNGAYAPDPEFVTATKFIHRETSKNGGWGPDADERMKLRPVPMSDYYDYLTGQVFGYIVPNAGEFSGPAEAFNPKWGASVGACWQPAAGSKRKFGMLPLERIVHVRQKFTEGLDDGAKTLATVGGGIQLEWLTRDKKGAAVAAKAPCGLHVAITLPAQEGIPLNLQGRSEIHINWSTFEQNMSIGADAAVEWLLSHQRNPSNFVNSLLKNKPDVLYEPVSKTGLLLRYYYFKHWVKMHDANAQNFDAAKLKEKVLSYNSIKKSGFNGYIGQYDGHLNFRLTNKKSRDDLHEDGRFSPLKK